MSPRHKTILKGKYLPAVILVLIFLAAPVPAISEDTARKVNPFVRFYQDHISPVDGDRCPMHPSCSEYARQAIQKHGPVLGWIMACDRLIRCGRDEVRLAPIRMVNTQPHTLDPVAANDFWWFTPPAKPLEDQP